MHKTQMSLAAILLGALIAGPGGAFAQAHPPVNAGKAQVEIKGAAAKTTTVTKTTTTTTTPGRMSTGRDPFVEIDRTAGGHGIKTAVKTVVATKVSKRGTETKITTKAVAVAPVIKPPPVSVTGIVESRRGNMAILKSPTQVYIVRSGDKLGDYHVTSIGRHTVAFAYKDKTFKLPLESEFPGGAGNKKGGGKRK
jgi:hypothetical protein